MVLLVALHAVPADAGVIGGSMAAAPLTATDIQPVEPCAATKVLQTSWGTNVYVIVNVAVFPSTVTVPFQPFVTVAPEIANVLGNCFAVINGAFNDPVP